MADRAPAAGGGSAGGGRPETGQFLEGPPVGEPVRLAGEQGGGRPALGVELAREAPFGAGEGDEVDGFASLGVPRPVVIRRRVPLEAQPLGDPLPLARVVVIAR